MSADLFEPGKIITFYSYKGGTGRSMAVANISCLLAKRPENLSRKILIIDWDLEAPGLHRYFTEHLDQIKDLNSPGLIDYFYDLKKLLDENPDLYEEIDSKEGFKALDRAIPLEKYIISELLDGIDFLKAGKFDSQYPQLVNSFDWAEFFDKYRKIFDSFKSLISSKYAYCLIDSRTGLTDISGICSMIMPEKLVTVFTPNIQSLYGLLDLIEKAIEYRRASEDLRPLAVFPLPCRIELAEKELRDEWRLKYQNEFGTLFRRIYELERCDLSLYFDQIQLQHVSYYSYGEKIAVLEEYRRDALSLSKAYERFLHYLVDFDFAWQELEQVESIFPISKKLTAIREPLRHFKKDTQPIKVFISSTYEDLKEYRKAAIEVVNRYKLLPLAMEFLKSKPIEPTYICENEIEQCDLFIGIYAHRYGIIPEGQTKSITQMEYELAKRLGKDCLCFIIDRDFPWAPKWIEMESYSKLVDFLLEVKNEKTFSYFKTVTDFEAQLSTSLSILISKSKASPWGRSEEVSNASWVPLAPTPFIAHPFPLPEHFTGRDAEMALLSYWFHNEMEPVLVLEAIGGMGKSALSWVWMQKEILEKAVEVDGVFWWSFYEGTFERFIQHLAGYVTGRGNVPENMLSKLLELIHAALHKGRFLLVLDGLERALRGYADMSAMYLQEKGFDGDKIVESEWDKWQREPISPQAAYFLKHLAASGGKTKTLITTRLFPANLEGMFGVKHIILKGLSEGDAVRFLRSEGIKGTRAELEQAGTIYDSHPLMLKLLSTFIKRSRTNDINEAFQLNLIDREVPHKILTRSFGLLSEEERQVAAAISVFRGVFTFESAKALFPKLREDKLWKVMQNLLGLGFLLFYEKENSFAFNSIMRSFLYQSLTNKAAVHKLAVQYFKALPEEKKIVSLEDLAPVIELYYHLVKSGKFDKAQELFRDKINIPLFFQLSAYQLQIELLKELFPHGEDHLPNLKEESAQSWTLNTLANTYAISGHPDKAVPFYLLQNKLREKNDDKKSLAIGLGNIAFMAQMHIGQLSASTTHLRKSITLCREIEDEFNEVTGHQELGRVLAYQGMAKTGKSDGPCAEEELAKSTNNNEKKKDYHGLSIESAHRSLSSMLQSRLAVVTPGEKNRVAGHSMEAVAQARKALDFVGKLAETDYPLPRDFVQAYWLLGESLIQCSLVSDPGQVKPFRIPFYDEYFQQPVEDVKVEKSSQLAAAERCLTEALRRCRKTNMVEIEPDILISLSRLEWAKSFSILSSVEENLKEAFEIAQRAGYRLKLADLHLFCGQVLLQLKEKTTLLGLSAYEHLKKTKEYALDVSEFSDLYQSPDPDFYKGIPEYQMLKRGMTHEERIQNGYWVAYKIADTLEKQFTTKGK
jgi:cellulose biosynthesis protein BcsQ